MKYIVVDEEIRSAANIFTEECETLEEAVKAAEYKFSRMIRNEKKNCEGFYILESENPDEEAENHLDGNIIRDLLKEWKENKD